MTIDVASAGVPQIKINKWDINAAKYALDDASKEIMKKHYETIESFRIFDTRLFLCTSAVLVTAFLVLYDYLYPYPQSRLVIIVCAVIYFIITSILSWHTHFIEKNIFFIGIQKDKSGLDQPNKWQLSSAVKKHNPLYNLTVFYLNGVTGERTTIEASKTIDYFFDEKGFLCVTKFESFLLAACNTATIKKTQ